MINGKVIWGIVGAGSIVHRWMRGMVQTEDSEVYAIASRRIETAQKAAEQWNIPQVCTLKELYSDPKIDIVYVAVPHQAHMEIAVEAMKHGKHVLCEKPAGVSEEQVRRMLETAKEQNVFYMEAVWTRFFPVMKKAIEMIRNGELGEIRTIEANFSFRTADDDASRLTDPSRAGGGLLDTGVYNLHLARMIYDKAPVSTIGTASIDTDDLHLKVDEQAAYISQYDKGELAVLMSGIRTNTLHNAYIYGTKGYLAFPLFWKPTQMEIVIGGKATRYEVPVPQKVADVQDEGYQYEIEYVNECIRNGIKESPELPWSATLDVVREMDKLRKQWGLKYPFEG